MARWWLGQETSTEIKSECLDILCDVLHRFGGLMTADHEKLLNALLVQLNLQRAGFRKRAIQCLGNGSFSYMPISAIPCCELHNQEQNCHHFIPQFISNTANCRKMDANPLLACLKAISCGYLLYDWNWQRWAKPWWAECWLQHHLRPACQMIFLPGQLLLLCKSWRTKKWGQRWPGPTSKW